MEEAFHKIKDVIASGCSEDEFKSLQCPRCFAALDLNVKEHTNIFHVWCIESSEHLSMYGRGLIVPEWWRKYWCGGWY
jgi:hypothetical protein